MSEVDKLLDELERQSELIAALRVEIATKDKRIKELEASHAGMAHDQLEIAKLLNDYGIEHSGFKRQAPRVEMLIEPGAITCAAANRGNQKAQGRGSVARQPHVCGGVQAMTNLTPGAKVIYFKNYNFDPAPARVGWIAALWPDDAVIVETTDDLALWPRCPNVHVPRRQCHLYSDALWSAWLQWQKNAK